jgi:hypothetical protein
MYLSKIIVHRRGAHLYIPVEPLPIRHLAELLEREGHEPEESR